MSGTSQSHSTRQSGATKRTHGEDTSSDIGPVKRQKLSKYYAAEGLKSSIHGNVYQLKLLTLFLKRGLDLGYSFTLATEIVEAEKFDDIVFGYTDENGRDVCRFLQAKHKQDETKKITFRDLLTEEDDNFSIKKYFISYRKIEQNLEFKGYYLRDFTICTNINLDENLVNNFEKITGTDDILHFEYHNRFRRYKINLDQFPEKDRLLSILRRTSEHLRLANMLAVHMLEDKTLKLSDLFKAYHGALGEKVIKRVKIDSVEVGKFRSEFIDGESDQSSVLERFRKSFYEEYQRVSKTQIDENDFWVKMKDTNLKISSTFGKDFKLDPDPELTGDKEALAEKIVTAIKKADSDNVVQILRESGKKGGIIKDNIDKLAGYVFVKKGDKNKKFYFNSKFLDENEKLPCHLEEFRTKFVEKREDIGIEFSKMNEYKFHIAKFVTCEEGQLYMKPSLPDDYIDDTDIQEFFKHFVLSVKQPNEEQLGDIIQEEIGKDFKLIDSDLMATKLLEDMLNWMKQKKGRFLTNEEGNELFVKIHQKVSKLVLIGPTLVYRAKMEQFGISFREDLKELQDFLISEKRIFNLISSCDDTIFSSIKVLQTLNNLNSYQTEDSYIYMRLDSLLYIWKRVMEAFSSETCNLLAIECKAKKNEADLSKLYKSSSKLYKKLSGLLKSNRKKKVILITLKNDTFAEKFKSDFSENNHYREIEDKNINLTDLIVDSQNKFKEEKVIFLGKEISLNAVVDAESTHLLSGEVLSMLIRSDKIELGKSPIDPTYIEVEDCFIDRTLTRHDIIVKSAFMKEENFLVLEDNNRDTRRSVDWCDYVKREIEARNHSRKVKVTDIIFISDSRDEFLKLCDEYRKQHCIHWLKKEKGNLYWSKRHPRDLWYIYKWQQSSGDLTELRRFINTSEGRVKEYKITGIFDKVILVAAEPGMGKSVLLSHLSLETRSPQPPLWIVRSDLVDHSSKFSHWMETNPDAKEISMLEAVKFLYKIIFDKDVYLSGDPAVNGKTQNVICLKQNEQNIEINVGSNIIKKVSGASLLEINLFTHFFNKGKVVLLFDGFDEISPHYNDLVVKLLKVLKDTKVGSMWLTTRPYNILSDPENHFGTFAYTVQPFLKEDQNLFLNKYWTKNMKLTKFNEQKVDKFIYEWTNQFSKTTNDPDRKFLSIPLQICMLADTLSVEFEKNPEPFWENENVQPDKLDLVTLYEKFLENKLDIEFKKIISNECDRKKPGALIDEKSKRLEFRIGHEILAVCSLFKVDQCKKVLSSGELKKIKELKGLISEAENKTGVIINIIDDKPEFIHRTFAEYFAAQFIWKKFISNKLEEFEGKIVCDIVTEILIENDAIQVSKFLALIAKNYFYSETEIDLPTWESKIKILLMKLNNKVDNYGDTKKDGFQSTKWLLGIVEFFLLKQDDTVIISQISENQSLKLLCVCAEMGYTKLAGALTSLNTKLLKQHLSQRKWPHCPLWLAAENNHLDMIKFLVERFSYDAEWQDIDGLFLIQHIFAERVFEPSNVLKSCLELDIIDCGPFKDQYNVERLPICEGFRRVLQLDKQIPRLLIEKTNASIVNAYIVGKDPLRECMFTKLLNFDDGVELVELALKKGIDFSFCLNNVIGELLHVERYCTLIVMRDFDDRRDFIDRCSSYYNKLVYDRFENLFPNIELLLKAGIGYNSIDGEYGEQAGSTYQVVKRHNDIYKLLHEIYSVHKQNDKENDDPVQTLSRLIFNYIRSRGFEAVEITINQKELLMLPHYQEECEHEFQIHKAISWVIDFSGYIERLENNLDVDAEQNYTICVQPYATENQTTEDFREHFPQYKNVMAELFFKHYILRVDGNSNLVKSAVNELKKRVSNLAESGALPIPNKLNDFRYYCAYICEMNYKSEMLENVDEENDNFKESLTNLVTNCVCDVMLLYYHQYYEITDALNEIAEQLGKLEDVINKLLKMKMNLSSEGTSNMILNVDQILDILGLKNIACEHKDLQKLVSEISHDDRGFNALLEIWQILGDIGQRNVMPLLEQMLKGYDHSKQIFDLFEKLHEGYENLICAVKEDDIDKVTSELQHVEQDFVKAIINGQDEHYGSPLHYAALNGQADIINIFLDYEANLNLRLYNNFEKITHFSQAVEKMKKDPFPSDDFVNWTPLYFAVLNDHEQVVQNLIERGANVNHVLNPGKGGYSPLHISALSCGTSSLKIAQLLLKRGARYDVLNKKGKTPLNLATSGSDVEKLLRSIDGLFRMVEKDEKNAVDSVFEVLDLDSWEAVLNAKNTDYKTVLELAENNAQKDIFELLSEKLRSVESRVLQSSTQ